MNQFTVDVLAIGRDDSLDILFGAGGSSRNDSLNMSARSQSVIQILGPLGHGSLSFLSGLSFGPVVVGSKYLCGQLCHAAADRAESEPLTWILLKLHAGRVDTLDCPLYRVDWGCEVTLGYLQGRVLGLANLLSYTFVLSL